MKITNFTNGNFKCVPYYGLNLLVDVSKFNYIAMDGNGDIYAYVNDIQFNNRTKEWGNYTKGIDDPNLNPNLKDYCYITNISHIKNLISVRIASDILQELKEYYIDETFIEDADQTKIELFNMKHDIDFDELFPLQPNFRG